MSKPIVLLAEQLSPATVEALGPDFETVQIDGTDRAALKDAIATADAILVRSATQVDAEAISWAQNLKVIARAGVGLDNVDVPAATQAGVMVVNAPTSNVISAAELTVAHILGLARNLQEADASLKAGQWKRSALTGVELYEKTVGIIGFGRIGGLVAERLQGFGVKILAFDPYITAARAAQLGGELVELDDLIARSDFITIHMPRTPETVGMIGEAQLKAMKNSAFVLNVARGGLIDEEALLAALDAGEIAGAALDVFTQEPPVGNPLASHPKVNVTPHLGASTDEAQEKAGISVAKSVRLALAGELVPDAVNVAGGALDDSVKPFLPLTEKLGQVLARLTREALASVEVQVLGEISEQRVDVLKLAALKGVFTQIVSDPVSYVNAPLLAEQRGIEVTFKASAKSDEFRNAIRVKAVTASGKKISAAGALTGPKQVQKLIEINGYDLETAFTDNLLVFSYEDRPGVVAGYGKLLGDAGVNIAGLQIGRTAKGGTALSVVTVDGPVAEDLVADLGRAIDAQDIYAVNLIES